jgi:ureidoglycolate dehydrogenase (NAD+)
VVGGSAGSERTFSPVELEEFCMEAMLRCEMRESDARITAETLVFTDTMGVHTHGTKALWPLLVNMRSGWLDANATPEVIREGPGWALVDGHYAMPMVTARFAMQTAINKARGAGVAYAGVMNSSHFGAAGYYANMAARQDMIGIATSNTDPCMTVPGGIGRILGTNPIAFAVPLGTERTVFLDIATSAAAANKIITAKALGQRIPAGWLVDNEGVPTTDPNIFPEFGAVLPMAGHKGYGLAFLVEVLSGVLTGAAMTGQVKCWLDQTELVNEGHAFIAIDVGTIMPIDTFKERVTWLASWIHESPKAKGSARIWLPGEMEWEKRERALVEGMVLPPDVLARLDQMAERLQLTTKRPWLR